MILCRLPGQAKQAICIRLRGNCSFAVFGLCLQVVLDGVPATCHRGQILAHLAKAILCLGCSLLCVCDAQLSSFNRTRIFVRAFGKAIGAPGMGKGV